MLRENAADIIMRTSLSLSLFHLPVFRERCIRARHELRATFLTCVTGVRVRCRNAEIMSRVIASVVIARVRVRNDARLYGYAMSRSFADAIFN